MTNEAAMMVEGLRSLAPLTLREVGSLVAEIALPLLVLGLALQRLGRPHGADAGGAARAPEVTAPRPRAALRLGRRQRAP